MTRILAIEGTAIRAEVEYCDGCPCFDRDECRCQAGAPNGDFNPYDSAPIPPPSCPLPEKTPSPPDDEPVTITGPSITLYPGEANVYRFPVGHVDGALTVRVIRGPPTNLEVDINDPGRVSVSYPPCPGSL